MKYLWLVGMLLLTGCASTQYIASVPGLLPPKPVDQVAVYYSAQDVPFKYAESGRVFIKNSEGSSLNIAYQVSRIKSKAAEMGADAVIILSDEHYKGGSDAFALGGTAASESTFHKAYQISGIAIRRQEPVAK